MSQVLLERATGMLTAGMSTRTVARELNVHFSTISWFQRCFRECVNTSNRPQNRRSCVTTPPQDLHIQLLHLRDHPMGVLRTTSACNKSILWGKSNSDWLGLASQWVGLAAKWMGLCPPRPTQGCTAAQSCEIHRAEWMYFNWLTYMNCNSVKSLKLLYVAFYIFVQSNLLSI